MRNKFKCKFIRTHTHIHTFTNNSDDFDVLPIYYLDDVFFSSIYNSGPVMIDDTSHKIGLLDICVNEA